MTRKFVVIGGGPSGLFFALMAKRRLGVEVEVFEQNAADTTYGFGVVLAAGGHGRFRTAEPEAADAIAAASFIARNRLFSLNGQDVFIEGGAWGGSIRRITLLRILADLCKARGIKVHHDLRIENPDRLDADVIVGADGVNSVVRRAYEGAFGMTARTLQGRMAWYGTTRHYASPILSFRTTPHGNFWAVGYSHAPTESTFVAECDADAWIRSGLNAMTPEERLAFSQRMFAAELDGHPLLSNRSDWFALPVIRCAQWSVGHRVLIGDALHSPHPSIGSGTRIAMEDAIALIEAFEVHPDDVRAALETYQRVHAPQSMKLIAAMEKSFEWYEHVGPKLHELDAVDLAFDFMMRTGRIDEARLRAEYPAFMTRYADRWSAWIRRRSDSAAA